jgi:hydrogenase/urease accessory protein HupE
MSDRFKVSSPVAPAASPGRIGFVAAAVTGLLLSMPSAASAHGVDEGGDSILDFVLLGTKHMLLGWDHLLFIIGVVLLAANLRRAAGFVSLFALGHSTTLIIATLAQWRINATAVDVVITLSVAFVGAVALFFKPGTPPQWRLFGAAVLVIGLVHGLGLSTRLQDIGVHSLSRIIAFNMGIELGQLVAILLVVFVAGFLPERLKETRAQRAAGAALIAIGIVGAVVVSVIGLRAPDAPPATATGSAACQVRDRTERLPLGVGGHLSKEFYEPNEASPLDDMGHVIGDGYVIVWYQPALPADQVTQLREFVTGPEGVRVVGGPMPEQTEPVKLFQRYKTLACTSFDLPAMKQFTKAWFEDPRSRTQ